MGELAIDIKDLWFSYHEHWVLKEVNLAVRKHDFLAILGPNGSGKTTLLKLMLGILKPLRGTVELFGVVPHKAVDRIGYVPQHVHFNKGFPISVFDSTLMGRLGHAKRAWHYSARDRARAQKALEKVGLWELRDRLLGTLSGGQRQRVFIARALAADPEILFMDEPTASVDREFQTELYEFLRELNKTVTIIVVSHDLSVLSSYIKSVACVNQKLFYHDAAEITAEMLDMAYHCPVELVAHGLPHRVLREHEDN
jgi:zinc transport system ATP-binding protein